MDTLTPERRERILQKRQQIQTPQPILPTGMAADRIARILEKAEAKKPPQELQTPQNLSFLEKTAQDYQQRKQAIGETISDFEFDRPSDVMTKPVTADYLSVEDAVTQVLGQSAGFAFDVASNVIEEGAEALWSVLPDSFTSSISDTAKEYVTGLANTDIGKAVIRAIEQGGEELDRIQQKYPQEYKTLASALNLGAASNRLRAPSSGLQIENGVRLQRGNRNFVDPLKGRDNDVFQVIKDDSKAARDKAVGSTTAPGILGTQQRLLTPDEEPVLDAVKKISKVNSANTMQQNLNLIQERANSLGKAIEAQLTRSQGEVSVDNIRLNINNKLNEVIQANPGIFKLSNPTQMRTALKEANNMTAQAFRYIDEYGSSAIGLHKARQAFDAYYKKIADRAFSDGTRLPATIEESYKLIRNSLNEAVDSLSPGTRALRQEQSNLITAIKNIEPKAAKEAAGPFGRMLQALGLGEARTPLAVAANLPVTAALVAVSPLYFGTQKFKQFWRSAPIQNAQGRAAYTLRDLKRQYAAKIKSIRDPEVRRQINSDLKVLTSIIYTLEQEAEQQQGEK